MSEKKVTPLLVSRSTAAALLGLKASTLREWACAKPPIGPPALKMGSLKQSRAFYRMDDIQRFVAEIR